MFDYPFWFLLLGEYCKGIEILVLNHIDWMKQNRQECLGRKSNGRLVALTI
jgi:hypothetical protein